MTDQKPSVGRIVHYVSYGTPGGEYTSQCRAAIITSAIVVPAELGKARVAEDEYDVSLCVLNPEGMFFNQGCRYDVDHKGGTWHWPERV